MGFTIWQDYLFAASAVAILVGLVPTTARRTVMPVGATLPIFLAVAGIAVGYATLGLWLSFSLTAAQTACWGVLTVVGVRHAGARPR